MSQPYDLLVVGGGTAGLVGAKTAAGFGARVLLVERDRTGGDCLWTGCVPSKSLLAAAHTAARARAAGRLGVHVDGVRVDFAEVMAHVRRAIAAIEPADAPASIEASGAQVRQGEVVFSAGDTALIDGAPVSFRQALIATGAAPVVPDLPGLAEARPLTSETVWELTALPDRLVVLGGGSIGCELAQAFARLGSQVTLIEAMDRLLPKEDPRACALLEQALRADGVQVRTGVALASVEAAAEQVHLDDGATVAYDRLLVAFGRAPRTGGLGLEAAGVATDDKGFVRVDARLRTTHPRIWAAGDLTGHPQFTHTAGVHGALAATNAVLGLRRRADTTAIPRVSYTCPEVAAIGAGEGARTVTVEHDEVDRAVADGDTAGFTCLVLDGKGRLVGATIVGPRAGESLGELSLAVTQGMRTRAIAGAIHAYPTYSDGVWKAAVADTVESLASGTAARALGVLAGARRRWVGGTHGWAQRSAR